MASKKASKATKRLRKAKKLQPTKPLTKTATINWSGGGGEEGPKE